MSLAADFVLAGFNELLTLPPEKIREIGITYAIPQIQESTIIELCNEAIVIMKSQPTLLKVEGECHVVGDLHGSLHDLIRFIIVSGISDTYLFLGDYVDRGSFSIETICLLLALYVKFPQNFYLIRGNHEAPEVCSIYGFKKEIMDLYTETVFNKFLEVFNWLPLAGVVGEYFCVHGGIAPSLQNIAKIDKIVRPLDLNKNSMVYNMLWSDPTDASKSFLESGRGSIQQYGQIAVEEFLAANNLKGMIRGHQYISNGIKREFNKTVFTVFSASFYKHPKGNKCGLLTVTEKSELKFTIYDSFPRFKREDALFYTHNENRIPTFVETSLARATTDQTTKNIPSTFADLKYGKNIKTGIFHKRMVPQRIRLTRFSASSRVKPIIPIHPIG